VTIIDTPEGIEYFQLLSMRGRLQLEIKGLGFRMSTLKAVNAKFGTNFRRKQQALDFLDAEIERRDRNERQHSHGGRDNAPARP